MSSGCLYLIPTPLNPEDQLDPKTLLCLQKRHCKSLILVEDHKVARRRWLHWGLEREAIENFELFNEHNQNSDEKLYLQKLRNGQDLFLFCDEGLPAFCDPGQKLVRVCRENKIQVKVPSFNQSTILAVALSGFSDWPLYFAGFPPRESEKRKNFWQDLWQKKETLIIMDTPYRLKKISTELKELSKKKDRNVFIGMNLTLENEKHYWGKAQNVPDFSAKEEFILVVESFK